MATSVLAADRVEILVIGNAVPDESFYWYDPSLRYRVCEFPGWAEMWSREEIGRWFNVQRAARTLVAADFVIELPYLSFGYPSIESLIRKSAEESMRVRNAGLLLPVPQTTLLASFAPDDTRVDEPFEAGRPLPRQNLEVLSGNLNTHFSIQPLMNPITEFGGLISEYHDANLFLMASPHPSADTLATVIPRGPLQATLGGAEPWLLRLNLSDTPTGSHLGARGYVWKCASPLTGVFFFPQGGYVATSVVPGAGYVGVGNLKIGEKHDYAWDIISHIVLNSTGRQIPDLLTAHRARKMFAQYHTDYAEAHRALEFADMVSSNSQTYPVWVDLARIEAERREAARAYTSGNVEGSIEIMESVLLNVESARRRADRVLSISLFFVHTAEYALVGSTFLITLSVTLHFVRHPRVKLAGITRYVSGEARILGDLGEASTLRRSSLTRWFTWRRTGGLIIPSCLTMVVLVAFSGWMREMSSWESVYAGNEGYGRVGGKEQIFSGLLVIRDRSENMVCVDPSTGTAWVVGNDIPGGIGTRACWPFELHRRNQTSLLVFAHDDDTQELRVLSAYTGLVVEIQGKLREPRVTYAGQNYLVQGYLELVPGSIRLKETGTNSEA